MRSSPCGASTIPSAPNNTPINTPHNTSRAGRAGTLLARYLSAHPRGALREEALVLAIEAADARGDRAVGEQLAHVYQGEFPAGRFLAFARSHTH